MPRPKTKNDLISLSNANYQKLIHFIAEMDVEAQHAGFPPGTMNRNIRDVLTHVHHWHLLLLGWYKVGMTGKKPEMPAPGYTWKMNAELNRSIWEKYQSMDLDDAKKQLENSFKAVQQIIEQHSEEELFEKKRYTWTGSTSLGAYLISATSSHYDWAFKLIKKSKK